MSKWGSDTVYSGPTTGLVIHKWQKHYSHEGVVGLSLTLASSAH